MQRCRQVTLGAVGGWCVVLDCCILHLELTAGVSGVVHVYTLWAEDADLNEVPGHQLLKSGLSPSPLHFAQFH